VHAQAMSDSDKYTILSAGFGYLFNDKINGQFSETFPYSSRDITTGTLTNGIFKGGLKDPFAANLFLIDLFNVEFLRPRHSIAVDLGMNSDLGNNYGACLRGGYAFIFPLHFIRINGKELLLFKPSMNLTYMFGYSEPIGSLDNHNKVIDLLGHQAGNQFTIDRTKNDPGGTYNSGLLNIYFVRRRLLLMPKISLSNQPWGKLFWSIDAGWAIPVLQSDKLVLQQVGFDDSSKEKILAVVGFHANGATTSLNNVAIQKIPSPGGLFLAINVGIYIKGCHAKYISFRNLPFVKCMEWPFPSYSIQYNLISYTQFQCPPIQYQPPSER
jgi:hypothetical protein